MEDNRYFRERRNKKKTILGPEQLEWVKASLLACKGPFGARGFTISRPSGFKLYEFEHVSLGSRRGPPATDPAWTNQLFCFDSIYAFGEFSIDAERADPEVTFRLIKETKEVLYELTLKRSELMPKR
jgi:hypothetical protein